ncbi:MAG: hypothetical protein M3Q81_05645 [bacterium]|nr:hypothetical protein [bacterium]
MPNVLPLTNSDVLEELYQQTGRELLLKHADIKDWLAEHQLTLSDLRLTIQQLLLAASISGSVFIRSAVPMSAQTETLQPETSSDDQLLAQVTEEEQQAILEKLKGYVKQPVGHLASEDQLYLEQQLTDILGFPVTAELEGHRLNHSIGIMGGEQHLKRFPTDTLGQHDAYQESGIAPNRGAFGWFTEDGQLTPEAIQREKYYFAVQTLYLPDWNQNHANLKPWYKFRKMVVINPVDEVAVVGVVGDAGPAQWVKKQFGGSPEVIREGKIWSPTAKGRVLLLFVDDPEDKIPLGPISLSAAQELALK